MKKTISKESLSIIVSSQQNEVNEALVYRKIARFTKDEHNKKVLLKIAAEEESHAHIWAKYTGKEVKPQKLKVFWWVFLARVLGFTFAVKKMENGEDGAVAKYDRLSEEVPEAKTIAEDEDKHEKELLAMLDEERLKYVGSMVLGLSDALVELSGTLAGLTFAMQNTRLIALSGLITGISATLSMASSEYLSAKSDGDADAKKSALYTGIAYVITVTLMVLPYLLFPANMFLPALLVMLLTVIIIIAFFSYYIAVAKDLSFKKRFWEMAGISLSVAAISFVIGVLVKKFLGFDI